MTKDEITEDIEATLRGLPERYDGGHEIIERKIRFFLKTDREAVVEAMEDWLDRRDSYWTMNVLSVARTFELRELCPSLKRVRREIVAGRFKPYYVQFLDKALQDLGCAKKPFGLSWFSKLNRK